MGKLIDITGKKFNRLTVIGKSSIDKNGSILWECICDCGKSFVARAYAMKTDVVKSCGCLNNELRSKRVTTHSHSKDKIYKIWKSMKSRCYRLTDKRYARYGGRGITVCNEWLNNPMNFIEWAGNNGYMEGLSIDRKNNDDDYRPNNCRFVSTVVNNQNSSNTHLKETDILRIRYQYISENKKQIDIAKNFGISQQTVSKIVNNKSWKNILNTIK